MKKSKGFVCTNIFDCNIAANFHNAPPMKSKYRYCQICSDTHSILTYVAKDLVSACPLCRVIADRTLKYNKPSEGLTTIKNCVLDEHGNAYCPYCNIEYASFNEITDKQGNIPDIDKYADILQIFLGRKFNAEQCAVELRSLIYKWGANKADIEYDACKQICQVLKELLGMMKNDKRKDRLVEKIIKTIEIIPQFFPSCHDEIELYLEYVSSQESIAK